MTEREFVILSRHELFEFLGKMALPPWVDVDGKLIGINIDCAPIVQEIVQWVRHHDMSGVAEVYERLLRTHNDSES